MYSLEDITMLVIEWVLILLLIACISIFGFLLYGLFTGEIPVNSHCHCVGVVKCQEK